LPAFAGEEYCMSTIVLAHGVLGFGDLLPSFLPAVHYFNGVRKHLEDQGHKVIAPQVAPVGSIQERGDRLAKILSTAGPKPLHIIAHSMGGLDARHAITNRKDIVDGVKTLVTIGTPHRGSPVADAVLDPSTPLFNKIPRFLVDQLKANAKALTDLTTKAGISFDERTNDVDGVSYIEVAGDASHTSDGLLLFDLAAEIGNITNEINDGVVTKSSALRQVKSHQHLEDWPVDHAGEIGWSRASPVPIELGLLPVPLADRLLSTAAKAHLARYDAIVGMLKS
jgi:triacylglycerol lipase